MRKNKHLNIPVTLGELRLLQATAEKYDVPMTALVRAALAHAYPDLMPLVLHEVPADHTA